MCHRRPAAASTAPTPRRSPRTTRGAPVRAHRPRERPRSRASGWWWSRPWSSGGDVGSVSSGGGRLVSHREALGVEPRCPHVDLRPQPQVCGATLAVEVEDHTLALAELAEDGASERIGGEIDDGELRAAHHGPGPGTTARRMTTTSRT